MVEKLMDMQYIALCGYIRNTPSDIEVLAEQLRADRTTRPVEKNI